MGAVLGTIGTGLSAVSPIANPLLQHYETNRQMHFQSDESAINRDWQTVEAEKARQFSAEQLQKQMDYNSPVYQANELRKAGLNPVIGMSNGSAVASVSGGSSAPVASPVQGVSPIQGQPVDLGIPQAVQSMGAFLKSIADAKKTGVETDYLEQTFYDAVAKFHSEQTLRTLEVASKEMDNYIKHRVKDARIEQAWQELEEVGTRVLMNQASAHETYSRADLDKALERMNDALARYHGENSVYLKLHVDNFVRDFDSMLRLRDSEIAKNRSSAKESSSNAEHLDIWNKIHSDKRFQHSIISQAVTAGQQAIDANKMTKQQVQHMNYMIEQAAYANDMKEFTYWSGQIQSYMQSVGQAASAFYGAGALRELIKLRKAGITSNPIESGRGYYLDNDGLLFKRP